MNADAHHSSLPNDDDEDNDEAQIPLLSIWDSPYVNKKGTRGADNEIWECLHCNCSFSKHNATKALWHVAKMSGQNIQPCRAKINEEWVTMYLDLFQRKENRLSHHKKRKNLLHTTIQERNSKAAHEVASKRSRKSSSIVTYDHNVNVDEDSNDNQCSTASVGSSPSLVQMRLGPRSSSSPNIGIASPASHFENLLSLSISDFIHANGLPFRIAECPHFKQILKIAKHVKKDYSPPNSEAVRTELLDTNYEQYKRENMKSLLTNADIYGLTLFGDGATIHKMPLVNLLASGVHNPCAVLEIFDCTDHLIEGDSKDASAICCMFLPQMAEVDPDLKLFDAIFFDGAGNVQMAGQFLSHHYPRVTVMHGAEHVLSLFFKDIAKLPPIKKVIDIYRLIYHLLGSGSHHAPYAIFWKHAKQFNDGRDIGLIQPSNVRMAGYFIALLQFSRLYPAVLSALNSIQMKEYMSGNKTKKKMQFVADVAISKEYIRAVNFIVHPLKPALKLLRMADTNQPAMDKLLYLSRSTTIYLSKFVEEFNNTSYFDKVPQYGEPDVSDNECGVIDSDSDADTSSEQLVASELDEFENESTPDSESNMLGQQIMTLWRNRCKKLNHSYAVAAWFCSVDPNVRQDVLQAVKKNETGWLWIIVDNLITKLLHGSTENEIVTF